MPATSPYTPTIMMIEMLTSTTTCFANTAVATVPSEITMISADRMKSVRTAPLILSRSKATRSTAGLASASTSSAWWASSSFLLCKNLCASFSNPS